MNNYLQAVAVVLSLINPVVAAAIFERIETGRDRRGQFIDASKAALTVFIILECVVFFGVRLLDVFGISLDAFSVAGGGVLVWMGSAMLTSHGPAGSANSGNVTAEKRSLSPLILFAASPGTMTGVITLSVAHSRSSVPVTAMVAVAVAVFVTWLVLLLSSRFSGKEKKGIIQDLTPRFMGLIIIAMGVQYALSGFKSFMAAAN